MPLAVSIPRMNEGSPDKLGSQAAAPDSPSPFKFPNKSSVEEQGVIKLRSQGRKAASAAKADDTPSTDRTLSAKTPVQNPSPALVAQRSPRSFRPELHASASAVLAEIPALPLPAESRPKITIRKLDASVARARADESSSTDSETGVVAERPAAAISTTTPRRVPLPSITSPLSSSKKVHIAACLPLLHTVLHILTCLITHDVRTLILISLMVHATDQALQKKNRRQPVHCSRGRPSHLGIYGQSPAPTHCLCEPSFSTFRHRRQQLRSRQHRELDIAPAHLFHSAYSLQKQSYELGSLLLRRR